MKQKLIMAQKVITSKYLDTFITKKENYPEVIKYYKQKPRDRENSPSALPLLRFLWKQILPCCDVVWYYRFGLLLFHKAS